MPRTKAQAAELVPTLPENVFVPDGVLDGPSLISSADLVVSAGGTMNREAAVLGTPAYTVFAGKQGAVDDDLIRRGLLVDAREVADVKFVRKRPDERLDRREPQRNPRRALPARPGLRAGAGSHAAFGHSP